MAANNNPVYALTPNTGARNVVLTAANTAKDGTGTTSLIYTAGLNGGRIKFIEFHAIGTNVTTLVRAFLNNGTGIPGTAANNSFMSELPLAASTLSETVLTGPPSVMWLNRELGAGERVYLTLATAVAAGWAAVAYGEDF